MIRASGSARLDSFGLEGRLGSLLSSRAGVTGSARFSAAEFRLGSARFFVLKSRLDSASSGRACSLPKARLTAFHSTAARVSVRAVFCRSFEALRIKRAVAGSSLARSRAGLQRFLQPREMFRDSNGRFARSDCQCRGRWWWVYYRYADLVSIFYVLTDGQVAARLDAYRQAYEALHNNFCPGCGFDGRGTAGLFPTRRVGGRTRPRRVRPTPRIGRIAGRLN